MKPIVAITMGDFNGIGPEVVLKSIISPSVQSIASPLLVGSLDVFEFYARRLQMKITLKEVRDSNVRLSSNEVPVIDLWKFHRLNIHPGKLSRESGACSGEAIEFAADLCLHGKVHAMVTAPVSKEALALGGYRFPGQTELLTEISNSKHVTMMLIAGAFRVGLATTHTRLRDVSQIISGQLLKEKLVTISGALRSDFGITLPRIAVLGLNPHAGENGAIGDEEKRIIVPLIKRLRLHNARIEGPFPADGFFGMQKQKQYDAVLAMYHDQGLIPLKMSGFSIGVNYSAGLKIVRTSPDHGTAFDIAGRNIANPQSMIEAIRLAATIIRNRAK
jgi:4-hydroxythreonine-4-phosphate dehydrogenase